jgi:hypothetical protein
MKERRRKMSRSSIAVLALAQLVMLVVHYGGVIRGLPWWVVWFPGMVVLTWVAFILFVMIVMLAIGFIAAFAGGLR